MAHKKGLGSSRNGRDSNAKRLGVKVFAGQTVTGGEIIVRQRGTQFKPGIGVGIGKDDTIYARAAGTVEFREGRRGRVISVVPAPASEPDQDRNERAPATERAPEAEPATPAASPLGMVRRPRSRLLAFSARPATRPPCAPSPPARPRPPPAARRPRAPLPAAPATTPRQAVRTTRTHRTGRQAAPGRADARAASARGPARPTLPAHARAGSPPCPPCRRAGSAASGR